MEHLYDYIFYSLFVLYSYPAANPHRLVIDDVNSEDSGDYGCTARNTFSYHISQERVTIECELQAQSDSNSNSQLELPFVLAAVVPVSPECIDNPYFANCKLIVEGKYCFNKYYAQFCCRSCTLAGQIVAPHPNAV